MEQRHIIAFFILFAVSGVTSTLNSYSALNNARIGELNYFSNLPGENCTIDGGHLRCWCLQPVPPEDPAPEFNLFKSLGKSFDLLKTVADINEAILILGSTGSGVTTTTQIVAGDLSKLHSVATEHEEIVIIDEDNKIGLPSLEPKTLSPEIVIKTDTKDRNPLHFFDLPGFDNTPEKEIATNFFMNEASSKITFLKMVFVIDESAVSPGVDRYAFNELAKHAVNFAQNIHRFSDSIGLVISQVSNYSPRGRYVEDDDVINMTVTFLNIYQNSLTDELDSAENEEERDNILDRLELVRAFLFRDARGNYPRIWFIRRPLECGRLSDSELMLQARSNITEMIEHLQTVRLASSSFEMDLSKKTLQTITKGSNEVISAISSGVSYVLSNFRV